MSRAITAGTEYHERMGKLIPAESTAAWLAIHHILVNQDPSSGFRNTDVAFVAAAVALMGLTALYLVRVERVTSPPQIVVTSLSLLVWAFAISGTYMGFFPDNTQWFGVVLVLWTMAVPILVPASRQEPVLEPDEVDE